MRQLARAVVALLFVGAAVVGVVVEAASRKALCVVCVVSHGESSEEEVKATRTYEGKEYGFCSETCAAAFDADPVAYVPATFPRPAPAFALKDLAGRPLSTESLAGKVVLLDFWATWCVPCRKTMPELQALHAKYADRGFTVVGISIDEGSPSKVKKFAASRKITYPIALDSAKQPAWEAYRVKAVPVAYLIDRDGQIRAEWKGAPPDPRAVDAEVAKLLASD